MKYLNTVIISFVIMLGGLALYQKFLLPKHLKKVYVVDTEKIIKLEKAKILQYAKARDTANFNKMLEKDRQIKKAIQYIADKDNAVVYVKKAILGGYDKDITDEVILMTGGLN
jgi:hypothetical protein